MPQRINIILFLFFSTIQLNSQVVLNCNLVTKKNKPIDFAIIKYENQNLTSNKFGNFQIDNYKYGTNILIKKLGFADTLISLKEKSIAKDTINLIISLRSKVMLLDEIPVYANKFRELNPLKADFILDYELADENIIELLSNDYLILLNNKRDILFHSKTFSGSENIAKDPFGNLNIITKKNVYRTDVVNSILKTDSVPKSLVKFNWAVKYCDEAFDTSVFIRRYKDINQTVAFFSISTKNSKNFKLLKEITDVEREMAARASLGKVIGLYIQIAGRYSQNLAGVMGDITLDELHMNRKLQQAIWAHQMLYVPPSYNVLKLVNDTVYLFAHDIDTLFAYDKGSRLIKSIYIDYHHLKMWGKEIIINEKKTKGYALFKSEKKIMV